MTVVKHVFGGFGVIVMIVSAMFVAIAISDLITGEGDTERGTLIGLVVLFTGAWFWGFNMARSSYGWRIPRPGLPRRGRSDVEKEQAVLAYATAGGGRVTVVEVAGRCHLSVEESKQILDRFAVHGVAEILIAEDGTMVYDFKILSAKEKAQARDLL